MLIVFDTPNTLVFLRSPHLFGISHKQCFLLTDLACKTPFVAILQTLFRKTFSALVKMPQSPTSGKRKVGIVVDANEDSMYVIKWAVENYIHPEDTVILLHVQPTDVLYGADWGDLVKNVDPADMRQHSEQDILSSLTSSELVWPLLDGKIPFKSHVVKDYDRKERICLEAERLKLSALVIGTRRTSGTRRADVDSISDYCMNHCECPVVVVRYGSSDDVGELENHAASLYIDSKI